MVGALFYMFEGAAAEMVDGCSQTQDEDAVTKPPRGVGVLCDACSSGSAGSGVTAPCCQFELCVTHLTHLALVTPYKTFLILAGAH